MTITPSDKQLLKTLLLQIQANEIVDIFTLAEESSLSLFRVLRSLERLQRAGLVDARRLRLTMPGAAVAAGLTPQARRFAESNTEGCVRAVA